MGRSNVLKHTPGDVTLSMRPGTHKDEEARDLITRSLNANPNLRLLAPFNQDQVKQLVAVAWKQVVEEGQDVMTEGDLNNETFYVVQEGVLDIIAHLPFDVVTVDDLSFLSRPKDLDHAKVEAPGTRIVKTVQQGASFGDSSMLYGTPRWGTARATCRCVVWVISQSDFKIVQLQSGRGARGDKTSAQEALIAESLKANENLQRLLPLGNEHINQLVQLAWREPVTAGKVIMREGDLNADAMYIIGEGDLEATAVEPFEVEYVGNVSYLTRAAHFGQELAANSQSKTVTTLPTGCCFGEISMIYCATRLATITAKQDAVLLAIDRSSFLGVQKKAADDEQKMRVQHLKKLEVLETFTQDDKEKLAGVMERMRFKRGEVLLDANGDHGAALFVLTEGSVSRTPIASDDKQVTASQVLEADSASATFHYFGEITSSGKQSIQEIVQVTSDTATLLVLDKSELRKIWDRLLEALPVGEFQRYATSATKVPAKDDGNVVKNLNKLGLLGNSALGPIELYQNKITENVFALKSQYKGLVVRKGLQKSIVRERKVWKEVLSPFIVRLVETFNEPSRVGFLMEACLGGELLATYQRHNLYGQVQFARYYAAGVVLALEHLHKRRFVYRNMKPQNILLTHDGYPKLTDLSLAKHIVGHTFTTCGTPTYMAPEIITGTGHTRAVDWWALGVLVYELMVGVTPFESEHPMEVYARIMRGISRVEMPNVCIGSLVGLIKTLLCQEAIDRLAMRQGGPKNVMEHAWFADFDWAGLRNHSVEPPYRPSTDQTVLPDTNSGMSKSSYLAFFSPAPAVQAIEYDDDGTGWADVFAS